MSSGTNPGRDQAYIERDYRFADGFPRYWSRVALPTAVALLLLSPFLLQSLGLTLFLVFLMLPLYMIHQYEEHAWGRFKADIMSLLPPGSQPVSDVVIFWVNIGFVWALYAAVLFLASYIAPAIGLIVAYTTILNGILHCPIAIRLHRNKAGLWTAIALFLPVGIYAAYIVSSESQASIAYQALGVGMAVLLHIITFVIVIRSARRQRA